MIQGYCKEKSDAIHPWGFMVNHHVEDSIVLPSSSTVGVKNFITYVCFKYEDTTAVNLKWIYFYFFYLKLMKIPKVVLAHKNFFTWE